MPQWRQPVGPLCLHPFFLPPTPSLILMPTKQQLPKPCPPSPLFLFPEAAISPAGPATMASVCRRSPQRGSGSCRKPGRASSLGSEAPWEQVLCFPLILRDRSLLGGRMGVYFLGVRSRLGRSCLQDVPPKPSVPIPLWFRGQGLIPQPGKGISPRGSTNIGHTDLVGLE